jgi:Ca2+-transporting ATPase
MAASLCNNSSIALDNETQEWKAIGDPTEVALVVASERAKLGKSYWGSDEQGCYQRVFEHAFDSERKLMSVVYKNTQDQCLMFCKGAPEELLRKCKYYISPDDTHVPLDDEFDASVSKQSSRMACQGLRVLGLAYKETTIVSCSKDASTTQHDEPTVPAEYMEQGLTFIGLIGLIDPPKKGVKEAIETCQEAGIRVMMITGDHVKTATAIATQLGIFNANQPDKVSCSCTKNMHLLCHITCHYANI